MEKQKVDDFEIIVNMKKNELFSLPYTFWNDGKPIKWEIVGNGDIVFLDKSKLEEGYSEIVYAKLKSGYVRDIKQKILLQIKNFILIYQ